MDRAYSILVGAVVVHDNKVLMLRRSQRESFMPGHWGVPAGKIEFGEGLDHAVARELAEESGLTAHIIGMVGHTHFVSRKDGRELHNLQLNFLLDRPTGAITLDESNDAFRWVAIEDIRDDEYDEFQALVIDQALAFRHVPAAHRADNVAPISDDGR